LVARAADARAGTHSPFGNKITGPRPHIRAAPQRIRAATPRRINVYLPKGISA
jgi:hypothetical protein